MQVDSILGVMGARAHLRPHPLLLEYELTHLCNLACRYCDRHTPAVGELQLSEIFAALQQFADLGMRFISLDGGEPLAHAHFAEIVAWLIERKIVVHLNSNGILIPKHLASIRKVKLLKVSVDGPPASHNLMRGERSFERAVHGIKLACEAGVKVELRCVVGSHNWSRVDALIDLVESWRLGLQVMFQPARSSLFGGAEEGSAPWLAGQDRIASAFDRIEERKRSGAPIANRWGSLRHFRNFPNDLELPCAAGWIKATMDPTGNLYHCGMTSRNVRPPNVKTLGAKAAFAALPRQGCAQCWCARAVEGNQAWGGKLLQLSRPLTARSIGSR
jgi:MoaA/NifB/PqqE/SkfB family radical SAM enzyme